NKIIIKCSITVSAGADLQAGKRAQTVLSVSQNLSILWANFAVLNIAPHKEVLVRQMSLENPMKKALACHLEIDAPTVGHDLAITTAYENRWAIGRFAGEYPFVVRDHRG